MKNGILKKNFSMIVTIGLFLLLFLVGSINYKGFASFQVFNTLFIDNAYLIIITVGITFVIISGGIDISVGSLVAFICMFSADLLQKGMNAYLVILICLAIGTFGGYIMGCFVHYFNIQPFIVTLAGQFLYRGFCFLISTKSISIDNSTFRWMASQKIKFSPKTYISISVIICLVVVILGLIILKYTKFGRGVYAIGGNQQSAALMGLNVPRIRVGVYALNGFCGALGGIVFAIYTLSGYGLQNIGLEMDAIASAVIGGTLLTGGVGNVVGSMFGVLIQGVILTLINFQGTLSSWWTKVAIAVLLCIFIILQRVLSIRGGKTVKVKGKKEKSGKLA